LASALRVKPADLKKLEEAEKSNRSKKGQLKGVCDMGPGGWFIACLLLWIAGFPMYLANRSELQRINGKSGSPAVAPPVPGSQHESQDFEVQLTKLARLKDSGVLSEEEFTAKKKAILGL